VDLGQGTVHSAIFHPGRDQDGFMEEVPAGTFTVHQEDTGHMVRAITELPLFTFLCISKTFKLDPPNFLWYFMR